MLLVMPDLFLPDEPEVPLTDVGDNRDRYSSLSIVTGSERTRVPVA